MLKTILGALLPMVVTFLLGLIAASPRSSPLAFLAAKVAETAEPCRLPFSSAGLF